MDITWRMVTRYEYHTGKDKDEHSVNVYFQRGNKMVIRQIYQRRMLPSVVFEGSPARFKVRKELLGLIELYVGSKERGYWATKMVRQHGCALEQCFSKCNMFTLQLEI